MYKTGHKEMETVLMLNIHTSSFFYSVIHQSTYSSIYLHIFWSIFHLRSGDAVFIFVHSQVTESYTLFLNLVILIDQVDIRKQKRVDSIRATTALKPKELVTSDAGWCQSNTSPFPGHWKLWEISKACIIEYTNTAKMKMGDAMLIELQSPG